MSLLLWSMLSIFKTMKRKKGQLMVKTRPSNAFALVLVNL